MKENKNQREGLRLTSIEIGNLWNTYMIESLVHHMFGYFLQNVDDDDIKDRIGFCLNSSKDNLRILEYTFKKEEIPIPRGIISEDINLEGPRLFSDSFYVIYTKHLARFALSSYSLSYTQSSHEDIRKVFKGFIETLVNVDMLITELKINKGLYTMPPRVPVPKEVDFVKRKRFFAGFFGDKRSLTFHEINQLYYGALFNAIGKVLMTGFSQVAKSKEIREFFIRGKDLSSKYYKKFTSVLINDDIAVPPSYDGEVTDNTLSPFSDRFMLSHVSSLITLGMGNYGMAISTMPRRDISLMYGKIIPEVSSYAKDGTDLMIKNGWMEQPPTAPDRESLKNNNK